MAAATFVVWDFGFRKTKNLGRWIYVRRGEVAGCSGCGR